MTYRTNLPPPPITITTGAGSGSPYQIPSTNGIPIRVAMTTAATSYFLTPTTPTDGSKFSVRDAAANSATFAITITAASGTIQGAASTTIAENGVEREWRYSATSTTWELIRDLPYSTTINNLLDYVASGGFVGAPGALQRGMIHPLPHAITLPAGLTGSTAVALTAATASTVITLSYVRAGASAAIASITFAAAGTVGTFGSVTIPTLQAGDVLVLTAPSTPDTALADIGIAILGTKQ